VAKVEGRRRMGADAFASSVDLERAPRMGRASAKAHLFRHEAMFYAGEDDFVEQISGFIRNGVERDEPALVVVSARKIAKLQDALGGTPAGVEFADMSQIGLNPARIIPAWRDFVDERGGRRRPFRGVGEPIWAQRTADELVECQRHESLLNMAFADSPGFWLVCPYDTTSLSPPVLDEARRSHPFVSDGGEPGTSTAYPGLEEFAKPFAAPLPEPPAAAETIVIGAETLTLLRRVVAQRARAFGFGAGKQADLVFAANEIASNSLRHGGGYGVFKIWVEDDAIVCEARDAGRFVHAMVGRVRPPADQAGGLGLWLANQLCDLVQIRTFEDGSVVRLRMLRAQ
jgi:anti-sigma regulatory factor (Ser/Thr protein kinase)